MSTYHLGLLMFAVVGVLGSAAAIHLIWKTWHAPPRIEMPPRPQGLTLKPPIHKWVDSCWTSFNATPMERRCLTCGDYQHRLFHSTGVLLPWVEGEHPKATELRTAGAPDRYEDDEP